MYTKKHVDLLIDCLRGNQIPMPGEHCLTKPDWKSLVELATRQCVASLLFRQIENRHDLIPNEAVEELRLTYFKYAARSMVIYQEFTRLFKILQEEDIPFIVLKGADLGITVYQEPALRPISDLDLLVRSNDIPRMGGIFEKAGYIQETSDNPLRARHHLPPFLKTGSIPVEVHWDIAGERASSEGALEGLWTRARSRRIGGVNACVLSPEDMLLHLSIHAAIHEFSLKLVSLYDIREIVRQHSDEIVWDQLISRAGQWKAAKALFIMLRLACDTLSAQVPSWVLAALRPPDFQEQYLRFAKEEIFAEGRLISSNLAQVVTSQKTGERLKMVFSRLFPSREVMHSMYPSLKSDRICLYYLARLGELYRKYIPVLYQIFLKQREGMIMPDRKRGQSLHDWLSDGTEFQRNEADQVLRS